MAISIIICTYMRPQSVVRLLRSIELQTVVPEEVLIVDGSTNTATEESLNEVSTNLRIKYHRVESDQRGLTRQRNVGLKKVSKKAKTIIFLDDDVILEPDYLKLVHETFESDPSIVGMDGFITNENLWHPITSTNNTTKYTLVLDGFYQPLCKRDRLRAALRLFPLNIQPGRIPEYSHGKSSLPPTGKLYEVDHLLGANMSYRASVFDKISFSTYFEGYGLYEDFDFSVRASRYGKLVTNTAARLAHHHAPAGRPNMYKYGQMAVKNGWYVWRLKHPKPGYANIIKWHTITILLALMRLGNSIKGTKKKEAFADFCGRLTAWLTLIMRTPVKKS